MDGVDIGVLTEKAGPLPVWAYGAIGGGILLLMKLRGGGSSVSPSLVPSSLPSAAQSPAQTAGSSANAPQPQVTFDNGQGVYDPNTGTTIKPGDPFTSGFLNYLSGFLATLANAPNNVSTGDAAGDFLSFGNGVKTFGNGANLTGVLDPGQTAVHGNPLYPYFPGGPGIPGYTGINPMPPLHPVGPISPITPNPLPPGHPIGPVIHQPVNPQPGRRNIV